MFKGTLLTVMRGWQVLLFYFLSQIYRASLVIKPTACLSDLSSLPFTHLNYQQMLSQIVLFESLIVR